MMKRLILLAIFLMSGLWSTVQAGTHHTLNDSSETTALGFPRQGQKVAQADNGNIYIIGDNVSGTRSFHLFISTNFGASWTEIQNIGNGVDMSEASNIFCLGDTAFIMLSPTGATPIIALKVVGTTIVAQDTVATASGANPTRLAGLLSLGGTAKYAALVDENFTTDSAGIYLSGDTLNQGMTWTRKWKDAQAANTGLLIPVYGASGIDKLWLKMDMNTENLYIYDTINGRTLAFDSLTQTAHGSAATDLQTPGYGRFWATHLNGDIWIGGWQRANTGTKGLVTRTFRLGWSGTTPTEGTWLADQQEIVSSANSPDNWTFNPTFTAVKGRADSVWMFYRVQRGTSPDDSVDVYRVFSSDTGKTWGTPVREITGPTSSATVDLYINLQAIPDCRSTGGTVDHVLIYNDSGSTATTSYFYAYTDTLYNPASTAQPNRKALNTKAGRLNKNFKGGPHVANKK